MKLLIDECVDWRLLRDLQAYAPRTVKQLGWEHYDDGDLLRHASSRFDVFLTVDKDLPQQQNLKRFKLAVVILRARTTRLADLRTFLPWLRDTLDHARPGETYILSWRDLR